MYQCTYEKNMIPMETYVGLPEDTSRPSSGAKVKLKSRRMKFLLF